MARKKSEDDGPPLTEQRLSRKKPGAPAAAPAPVASAPVAKVVDPKVVESGVLPSSAEYLVEYDSSGNYRIVVGGKASAWVHTRFIAAVEKDGVVFFALSDLHAMTTLLPADKVLVATSLPTTEVVRQKK